MANLDSILKSREITLPTKVHLVKAMVFPVVMYGCESWTIKKAECQRIDALELWYWRRLLRGPWTARRSNQSILKEISPEYSLEGLRLKLKLQYFGHLMGRTDSLEKTLMMEKIEGGRRRGRQRMIVGWHHQLDGHEFEQALDVGDGRGGLPSMGLQRVGQDWATELNWSNEQFHQAPWSTECFTPHPEFPLRVSKVNSCRNTGFSLSRGRWQMPLLFFVCWQCSWQVSICSWHLLVVLSSLECRPSNWWGEQELGMPTKHSTISLIENASDVVNLHSQGRLQGGGDNCSHLWSMGRSYLDAKRKEPSFRVNRYRMRPRKGRCRNTHGLGKEEGEGQHGQKEEGCWAAPHRPAKPAFAQLWDQRKSTESATETSVV